MNKFDKNINIQLLINIIYIEYDYGCDKNNMNTC